MDAYAVMTIKPIPKDDHEHNRRAPKLFKLTGHENSQLKFITPDLQRKDIKTDKGRFAIKPTGKANYHALFATRLHNQVQESAIRYVYFNGKPTGHSPREITSLAKAELEIIPDPLPREHWHYKAGEKSQFYRAFSGHAASIPSGDAGHQSFIYCQSHGLMHRDVFLLPCPMILLR